MSDRSTELFESVSLLVDYLGRGLPLPTGRTEPQLTPIYLIPTREDFVELALALHDSGIDRNRERAEVLVRNLYDEQGGQDRFGTIHFGRKNAYAWYDHGVESTAWALRALVAIAPEERSRPKIRNATWP